MNERIRKLAKQADKWAAEEFHQLFLDNINADRQELFNKKFAELIVRECIIVCWPGGESDILYEQASAIDKAFIDGQDACVERLKQHFGVES